MNFISLLAVFTIHFLQFWNKVHSTSIYSFDRARFSGNCFEENCTKAHFSYERGECHGPASWHEITPCWRFCQGEAQSPININSGWSLYQQHDDIRFENLCTRVDGRIRNNGHSPHFSTESRSIKLTNVPYFSDRKYVFEEIHVHRGKSENRGSEHSIDGHFYPMEAHMVFYDDRFPNISAAKMHPGGLAVIGVMIKIADDESDRRRYRRDVDGYEENEIENEDKHYRSFGGNPHVDYMAAHPFSGSDRRQGNSEDGYKENESNENDSGEDRPIYCGDDRVCKVRYARNLSYLMETYYRIIRYHFPETVPEYRTYVHVGEGITPSDVLPYDGSFYTYSGSLTTPPCYESVQWIILRCPIKVSRKAFEMLGRVHDVNNEELSKFGIRRPIQRNQGYFGYVNVERNFRCWSPFYKPFYCW